MLKALKAFGPAMWANALSGGGVEPELLDRARFQQVRTLFQNAPFGTIAASAVAICLALILGEGKGSIGPVPKPLLWAACVVVCCIAHLILCAAFWRAKPAERHWRPWMAAFTAMAFIEGLAWCLGASWMLAASNSDEAIVLLLAWAGVNSAGMVVFGAYPPAYIAYLYPALAPHLIYALTHRPPYYQLLLMLEANYLVALPVIAIIYSAQMTHGNRLQLENSDLAEREVEQRKLAEAANLAKSQFLAAASHDLRQPVHALGLFMAALQERPLDVESRRIVDRMITSTDALSELFSGLLDISKLDAGAVAADIQSFDLGPILRRVANDALPEALVKGLSLRCVETRLWVKSDPVLVERILRNLVSNAVRYTEYGGLLIGCRRKDDHVVLEVLDTGIGISPSEFDHIFREFYQIGNTARDRTRGLGLGLAIVERTALLIHSDLIIRSELGKGSVFGLLLGRARNLPAAPFAETLPSSRRARIIVIEDEPEIAAAMEILLLGWGHSVETYRSAKDALAPHAPRGLTPDLIISDYRLPDETDGAEAIRALRHAFGQNIPAMLVTGDTAPERILEAKATGLLVLHKPVAKGKLRAAVGNLLRAPA